MMARIDRIVKRNGLKQKLDELQTVMRESKVILAAQNMLQNVFRDGFAKGWQAREDAYNKPVEVPTTDLAAVVDVVNNPTDQVQL